TQLSKNGIPCPVSIADNDGQVLQRIHDKPALLVTRLPGESPVMPRSTECYQAGELLAAIHLTDQNGLPHLDNLNGLSQWRRLTTQLSPALTQQQPQWLQQIATELARLSSGFFHKSLPTGLCHSDLFPDNTLFVRGQLTGVLDFHFACHERLIYDVAILMNAWGFEANGSPCRDNLHALWQGYCSRRCPTAAEIEALNDALRAAALRFLLTRLRDHHFPRHGSQVLRKPPEEYQQRLTFHQQHDIRPML
ncbi:MAG: phosphotransferase, partial [Magnetococcales bacterium]|nr:phosphotransferase [Magnetococcales bacterium]